MPLQATEHQCLPLDRVVTGDDGRGRGQRLQRPERSRQQKSNGGKCIHFVAGGLPTGRTSIGRYMGAPPGPGQIEIRAAIA